MTEFAEYDGFGRRTAWEYTAISPSAPPLARIDAIRDVTGRIRSLTTEFGHPITMGSHDVDWRGYQYDRRGYLEREWTSLGPAVDTTSIVPNGHPVTSIDAAIDALGGSVSATPWDQERALSRHAGEEVLLGCELEVGGLTAIRNADDPTDVLWSVTQARDRGHRLSEVQVDQTTYPIAHDEAGRLTTGPIFDFVYDANHRLSVVEVSGSEIEFYMYSADGDLAAVYGRSGPQVFAYDGTQMIAAFDTNGVAQWEATERYIPRVARSFAGLRRPSLHRPPRRFEGIVCVGRLRPGRRILAETPVRPHGMYRLGDGIDQLIEYRDFAASSPVVPLADHRNSPIATWNPTTEAIEQLARYDLHGRLTLLDANEMQLCAEQDNPGVVCDPPSAMPFAFNGRWRSPLTGLVNMRARWYSPRLGQFTAPDPLGYIDLYNLYGFAAFDPVNGWDPSGAETFCFINCRKKALEQQFDLPRDDPQELAKQKQAGEEMMTGAGKGARNMGKTIACMGGTAWAGPLAGLAACSLEVFRPEEMEGPFEEVGDNIVFTVSIAGGPELVVVGATRLLQLLRSAEFVKWLAQGRGMILININRKVTNKALRVGNASVGELMRGSRFKPTQRRLNKQKVEKYANMMRAGTWDWGKEKIIVDSSGHVMSGHHRVAAAQKASVAIPEDAIYEYGGTLHREVFRWDDMIWE